jgi:hypothetical protein
MRLGGAGVDEARCAQLDHATAAVPQLSTSAQARREFVQSLRAILNPDEAHRDDGSFEFFMTEPDVLFQRLTGAIPFDRPAGRGGATSVTGGGAAAFCGDLVGGITAAARRIANIATYLEMKTRSGTVGRAGVGPVVAQVRLKRPGLPIAMVGHSFGGRVITAAASTFPPDTPAISMLLLQTAYSHNGLAEKFDGTHDGAFRTVLADRRISGPVLITHTKNDQAVGIAYPLASRISHDVASALGDANDPFGGMGRNGAQHTGAIVGTLHAKGAPYQLQSGKVYNLLADTFIKGHSDVTGEQVAYACAQLLA